MIADEAPGEIIRLGVDDEMLDHFGLTKGGRNLHIDGILTAVGGEALWEYLMKRLENEYPTRDYTRVIQKPDLSKYDPETIQNIRDIVENYRESITSDKWTEIESELEEVNGFINRYEKEAEIDKDLGAIVKEDNLLKELASKLAEVKPILDKIEELTKQKRESRGGSHSEGKTTG
jgi:hypothetical protein